MIRTGKNIYFETKEELCSLLSLLQYFYNNFEKAEALTEADVNLEMITSLLELYSELKYMKITEF